MQNILQVIDNAIDGSIATNLNKYIKRFYPCKKWFLISDYCIGDKDKPNDVATFTLLPYIIDPDKLQYFISHIAPNDLKKTTEVSEAFLHLIKSSIFFSFCFIIGRGNEHPLTHYNKKNILNGLEETKNTLDTWKIETPSSEVYFQRIIRKINTLKQEVVRQSFNIKLLRNIYLLNFIAAYIGYRLMSKEAVDGIMWMSDRDNIIDAHSSIAFDLFALNHHGLCSINGIKDEGIMLAVGANDKNINRLFYDELIRIPDYISGTIADHCFINNAFSRNKYIPILKRCIADNPQIAIIKLASEEGGIRGSRVIFSNNPIVCDTHQ